MSSLAPDSDAELVPAQITDSGKLSEQISASLAARLRALTPARVGLRRTGTSMATNELLDFQLAHARARDAVNTSLQPGSLLAALRGLSAPGSGGKEVTPKEVLLLHSAATNRQIYLQRPDLGRRLDETSCDRLHSYSRSDINSVEFQFDVAIILVDGLSALAVERHAIPLLTELLPALSQASPDLSADLRLAPICVVEEGRVAIGDEIGHALSARLTIVLIGERPGLSSPDSLGAYITWQPQPGRTTDAERNCISNIRTEGLSYTQAAARLLYYIHQARRMQLTGVALKDPEAQLGVGMEP